MSTLTADPGFARGQVLGITKTYYDAQVGDGSHITGVEKVFLDTDPHSQIVTSNRTVTCVAAKNTSGAPLLPGTVVQFKSSAILTEVEPAVAGDGKRVGVVDEYLPAAGVPDGEVFWVVVDGPASVIASEGAAGNGLKLVADAGGKVDALAPAGFFLGAPSGSMARVLLATGGVSASVASDGPDPYPFFAGVELDADSTIRVIFSNDILVPGVNDMFRIVDNSNYSVLIEYNSDSIQNAPYVDIGNGFSMLEATYSGNVPANLWAEISDTGSDYNISKTFALSPGNGIYINSGNSEVSFAYPAPR